MNPITDSYDLVFNDRTLLVLLCLKKMAFVYALIRGIALLKKNGISSFKNKWGRFRELKLVWRHDFIRLFGND